VEKYTVTIDQIREALQDRNLKEVERRTGVHYVTLSRIRSGAHTNPRYKTVKTLEDYFKEQVA
jgi:transcriptional regulator with XRE-family HTH domain